MPCYEGLRLPLKFVAADRLGRGPADAGGRGY